MPVMISVAPQLWHLRLSMIFSGLGINWGWGMGSSCFRRERYRALSHRRLAYNVKASSSSSCTAEYNHARQGSRRHWQSLKSHYKARLMRGERWQPYLAGGCLGDG